MSGVGRIPYTLYLHGDLHIGSGVGMPGQIDEYALRDDKGFSYIPFSEIKGRVRDSCGKLLKYLGKTDYTYMCNWQKDRLELRSGAAQLDRDPSGAARQPAGDSCGFWGDTLCTMCAIFGSPTTEAAFWFSPAQYPEDYRENVKLIGESSLDFHPAKRDSETSAHSSLDPITKRAQTGHLFNFEVVRPSSTFEGYIEAIRLPANSKEPQENLTGWLTASLLFTRRIGKRKRRGWGKCRFVVSNVDEGGEALSIMQQLLKEQDKPCSTARSAPPS